MALHIATEVVLAAAKRAQNSGHWRTIDELADTVPAATKSSLLKALVREQEAGLLDSMNPRWAWLTPLGWKRIG